MEVQQFEQAILKMAFETDARITTASVAYYLGIPSKRANELLERLLEEGVLELDSDDEGNLYYLVPNQGSTPSMEADDSWHKLEAAADAAAAADSADVDSDDDIDDPGEPSIDDQFVASVDDDEQPSFSPAEFSPHQGADGNSSAPPTSPSTADDTGGHRPPSTDTGGYRTKSDDWFGAGTDSAQSGRDHYGRQPDPHSGRSRFDGVPDGVTSRIGRTDARAGSCRDDASVVVENAASCEPRPLAESKPTVTSCNDVDTSKFSTHQDYGGFGFTAPDKSTALATTSNTGEMTLTADNHIDQPEHQPGMALLLSLILCGTGQIYNGEVSKGIIMLILCFLLWFVFLGWVVHIWSIVDAVVVAERINRKSGSSSQAQN